VQTYQCCFDHAVFRSHNYRPVLGPQCLTEVLGISCGVSEDNANVLVLLLVSAVPAFITIGHFEGLHKSHKF
jgi:hypothetical protein